MHKPVMTMPGEASPAFETVWCLLTEVLVAPLTIGDMAVSAAWSLTLTTDDDAAGVPATVIPVCSLASPCMPRSPSSKTRTSHASRGVAGRTQAVKMLLPPPLIFVGPNRRAASVLTAGSMRACRTPSRYRTPCSSTPFRRGTCDLDRPEGPWRVSRSPAGCRPGERTASNRPLPSTTYGRRDTPVGRSRSVGLPGPRAGERPRSVRLAGRSRENRQWAARRGTICVRPAGRAAANAVREVRGG